ncbi:hypothetical protein HMI50_43955 [Corallococcus carmarthensis]|uniref:Uncharacterized protein n=2 Tax=Corallococcus carmarthensis TaxID=2316728 RepID=A0A3A8JF68_9BACT|nr:hypothetical protein [Corallococcus carmarthensis]RKG93616.1 hypothetical protein D7X32_43620 [Corallococcus carmarthensis]
MSLFAMRTTTDMAAERGRKKAGAARVFSRQPERIAALWRRMRLAAHEGQGVPSASLLDGLVEPFVRELGLTLEGVESSPWSRTRAVLRLAPERGARALHDEFALLRRCLVDALEVLGGGDAERQRINRALDEAVDSAVALLQRMADPKADGPRVPFGGLVVEYFERPSHARRAPVGRRDERSAMH